MTDPLPTTAPGAASAMPVTHRRFLALAVPMMASHVTTPLLGFVGTAAIGRLGDPALLGAIALGAVVFDFVFWTFGALRMATAGLTAQAVGRGDRAAVDLTLARALLAGVLIGVLLIFLRHPISWAALAVAGASPATSAALAGYIAIRIFAAPLTIANYAILGCTMGRGRTDLGLVIQVGINLTNIGLTALFVLGMHLAVSGAALAAVLAEAVGLALGLVILRHLGSRPFRVDRTALFDRRELRRMAMVNGDVMVRTAALMTAFTVFASLGARSGDTVLAANAVLQNMFLIGSFLLDGFATAAETLCGQAVGAGDASAFRRAVRMSLQWCLGFGGALAAGFLAGGTPFIHTVTTNAAVRDVAARFLPFAALAPLVGAAAFAMDGIYVGATWTRAMRNLMLIALGLFLTLLALLRPLLGNGGLWVGLLVFLGVRGFGQALLLPGLARATFGQRAGIGQH